MRHDVRSFVLTGILILSGAASAAQPVMTGSSLGGVPQSPVQALGLNGLDGEIPIIDPALGAVNTSFSTLDSTIAMLSKLIDVASMIPVFGPFAQGLKPVLNTYLDLRSTVQPLLDTASRGRAYIQKYVDAKNTFQKLFTSNNLNDTADNLNNLINQVSGLPGFPNQLRVLKASDPRASTNEMAKGVTQMIERVRQDQQAAKASGDVATYRAMLAKEQELNKIRSRIRQAGEMAAAQSDQKKMAEQAGKVALEAGQRAQSYANELQIVQSDVGSLKILGRIASENLSAQSAGFNTLSQQLALISQQQTVSNEQNDQLLDHFQQEERKRIARVKTAIEQETVRREQEYRQMVGRSDQLADAIGQTLKPSSQRATNARDLLLKDGQ